MICLKIDYRFATIQWWEWSDKDKEETRYNLFGDKAIVTFFKRISPVIFVAPINALVNKMTQVFTHCFCSPPLIYK